MHSLTLYRTGLRKRSPNGPGPQSLWNVPNLCKYSLNFHNPYVHSHSFILHFLRLCVCSYRIILIVSFSVGTFPIWHLNNMTTTLCFDFYSIYSYCQSLFNHCILLPHFHAFHSTPQPLSLLFMHSLLLIILLYLTSSPHPSTPLSHFLIDIKVVSRKITSPPLTSPLHPS